VFAACYSKSGSDICIAGHHGAIQAAKLGKKVAVVNYSSWGASINTGTIPSKTLREAVLRSTRSGPTDRRISASNLAQRIEEVASNEVRVPLRRLFH
jgi:NAD(P) transhydrogenase